MGSVFCNYKGVGLHFSGPDVMTILQIPKPSCSSHPSNAAGWHVKTAEKWSTSERKRGGRGNSRIAYLCSVIITPPYHPSIFCFVTHGLTHTASIMLDLGGNCIWSQTLSPHPSEIHFNVNTIWFKTPSMCSPHSSAFLSI